MTARYPKNWAVPGYAHAPFSAKLLTGRRRAPRFRMDPVNISAKLDIALPVPVIIAIEVLGGDCKEAVEGRGWYRSKER